MKLLTCRRNVSVTKPWPQWRRSQHAKPGVPARRSNRNLRIGNRNSSARCGERLWHRFRLEHQPRPGAWRRFTQIREQRLRSLNDRQAIAAALLAGADGHRPPMSGLRLRLRGIEPNHAALAQYRHDARYAKFRGLLDDEIHSIAARHALYQGDCQRRFSCHHPAFAHECRYARTTHGLERE